MGASLLDDVLAETLDPAYAQAAAARAAQAGDPNGQARTGRVPAAPRRGARALVCLTMAVAGLLVAVTYDQAAAKSQGRAEVRTALIGDIDHASAVSDELAVELADLRTKVSGTREKLLRATTVGQRALDELARAEQGAAAVAVSGPGLLVTLANADPKANQDPVGGTTEEDAGGRVRDGDLQQVVNALWAAGAEAVSINGQRLGPTSAIRFAGEAVLVDFRPVTNPYEIKAIGDPDTLFNSFLASPEVSALALISETYDLRFDLAQEDELTLPPAGTPELRTARPATPGPAAPTPATRAPADPEPSAPASDATPGGPP
jgi:uncharacterized protein YlxW (UPF0749 family)